MSKFSPTVKCIVSYLQALGYQFRECSPGVWINIDETGEPEDPIIIGIFSNNSKGPGNLADKVAAEADETFNKWSQVYYTSQFPSGSDQYETLAHHLTQLLRPEHLEAADAYERWNNTFGS